MDQSKRCRHSPLLPSPHTRVAIELFFLMLFLLLVGQRNHQSALSLSAIKTFMMSIRIEGLQGNDIRVEFPFQGIWFCFPCFLSFLLYFVGSVSWVLTNTFVLLGVLFETAWHCCSMNEKRGGGRTTMQHRKERCRTMLKLRKMRPTLFLHLLVSVEVGETLTLEHLPFHYSPVVLLKTQAHPFSNVGKSHNFFAFNRDGFCERPPVGTVLGQEETRAGRG